MILKILTEKCIKKKLKSNDRLKRPPTQYQIVSRTYQFQQEPHLTFSNGGIQDATLDFHTMYM